ncbi:AraC family transcriptional regulator [Streptomyces niveus]|uniref:AraC family transcriptional regulator n=1 Tax=Streptomyces niveus TaxID=193462 RepID=UPI000D1C0E26|nr:AraC family transcriptional regulator [Streptomyces niveus]
MDAAQGVVRRRRRVGSRGGLDGVTEGLARVFLDDIEVDALFQEQGRGRVPQVVEADQLAGLGSGERLEAPEPGSGGLDVPGDVAGRFVFANSVFEGGLEDGMHVRHGRGGYLLLVALADGTALLPFGVESLGAALAGGAASVEEGADVHTHPRNRDRSHIRDLIDSRYIEGISLREAPESPHAHLAHLVRAFSRQFGVGPHQCLTGRRGDRARTLLLGGMGPLHVAVGAGFCDQSHPTRRFKRVIGTSPGRPSSPRLARGEEGG